MRYGDGMATDKTGIYVGNFLSINLLIDRQINNMNGLLSVSETAVVLGCTRQSVLELIQRGRLRAAKLGNQWTIKRGDVVGYQWEKARREAGK